MPRYTFADMILRALDARQMSKEREMERGMQAQRYATEDERWEQAQATDEKRYQQKREDDWRENPDVRLDAILPQEFWGEASEDQLGQTMPLNRAIGMSQIYGSAYNAREGRMARLEQSKFARALQALQLQAAQDERARKYSLMGLTQPSGEFGAEPPPPAPLDVLPEPGYATTKPGGVVPSEQNTPGSRLPPNPLLAGPGESHYNKQLRDKIAKRFGEQGKLSAKNMEQFKPVIAESVQKGFDLVKHLRAYGTLEGAEFDIATVLQDLAELDQAFSQGYLRSEFTPQLRKNVGGLLDILMKVMGRSGYGAAQKTQQYRERKAIDAEAKAAASATQE